MMNTNRLWLLIATFAVMVFISLSIANNSGATLDLTNAIIPSDLVTDNAPADNYVASFDQVTGNFTWGLATSSEISVPSLAGATYTTFEEWINNNGSSGVISGGVITDGGLGTIDISAASINIRSTDSEIGDLFTGDYVGATGVALTDETENYVYIEYNAGVPQEAVYTSPQSDHNSAIIVGIVYRTGTSVHITTSSASTSQLAQQASKRLALVEGLTRQVGSEPSEVGTRNIAITTGLWWMSLDEFVILAIDTSASDTFSYFYSDGAGSFTEVASSTQISNTSYDDGTGILATLGNAKYGVHWVYRAVDGDTLVVYGSCSCSLSEAGDLPTPATLPVQVTSFHAGLVAKIIIQKSDPAFTSLQSPYGQHFAPGVVSSHAALSDLAWSVSGHTIDGNFDLVEFNIQNAGDVQLDSLTADDGSTITVNDDIDMTNADLNNIGDASTDITSTLARFGVPNEIELNQGEVYLEVNQGGIDDGKVQFLAEEWNLTDASWQSVFEIVIGNNSCAGFVEVVYVVVNTSAGEMRAGSIDVAFSRRTNNSTLWVGYNQDSREIIHVGSALSVSWGFTLTGGATDDPQDLNFWVIADNGNNTDMNMMLKAEMTSIDADGNSCDLQMKPY